MIDVRRRILFPAIAVLFLALLSAPAARAEVTPGSGYSVASLAAADPAPYTWVSSVASYGSFIIYAGADKKIHAYNATTGATSLVCDTSALSDPFTAVAGFLVTPDGWLYFHANTFPTTTIYRLNLGLAWPTAFETLATGCQGSIYSFARNPWTGVVWFASSDFTTHKMYLYQISPAFNGAAAVGAGFDAPHGGGSGPLVFTTAGQVLYGESVWDGNGYFHLVDAGTGAIVTADYLTFTGGLVSAVPGGIGRIYAATGNGKTIYEIAGTSMTAVAAIPTFGSSAQGVCLSASGLFVAEQNAAGLTSFSSLVPLDDTRPITLAAAANPAPYTWNASIAFYNDVIIYAGVDRKIHAYEKTSGANALICDTSALSDPWSAVAGFMVTKSGWLYFHANTFPTTTIYRLNLAGATPAAYETLATGCQGSIYAICQNPWDETIWMASSDLGANTMYLYQVAADFSGVTLKASFAAPHGGGSGPIIFASAGTLLYGESVWAGNGYFHLVDTATGLVEPNVLTFTGGLAGAAYGRNLEIYATSGDGKTVYKVTGDNVDTVAVMPLGAQGIVYDGYYHWVSVMDGASGKVSLYRVGIPPAAVAAAVKALGSSGGCFIGSLGAASGGASGLALLGLLGAACLLFARRRAS